MKFVDTEKSRSPLCTWFCTCDCFIKNRNAGRTGHVVRYYLSGAWNSTHRCKMYIQWSRKLFFLYPFLRIRFRRNVMLCITWILYFKGFHRYHISVSRTFLINIHHCVLFSHIAARYCIEDFIPKRSYNSSLIFLLPTNPQVLQSAFKIKAHVGWESGLNPGSVDYESITHAEPCVTHNQFIRFIFGRERERQEHLFSHV